MAELQEEVDASGEFLLTRSQMHLCISESVNQMQLTLRLCKLSLTNQSQACFDQ